MMPRITHILKRVIGVLGALPILAGFAGLILGPTVLHPFRRLPTPAQFTKAESAFSDLRASRDEIAVEAPDRILLRGWKVHPRHPNGDWVLLLHGRSHNRAVMMPYAEFLLAAGFGVVMMDARAHGASDGSMSTYGYLETSDIRTIVDALEASEHVSRLFALGESMGAAVALESAALEPRIDGVIAEGAFRNLHEVTFDYAGLQQSELLGKTLFRPAAFVAVFIAQRQGGFRFENVSPEKSVALRAFPVLLICGASDRKIPCRHSEAIYRSAPGPKQLWEVPATGHEQAINTAPQEFQRRVLQFLGTSTVR
jgi:pimeloyl-ACP methyl ester carboxylesterase